MLLTYIFTNFYLSFTVCHVNSCDLSNRILDNKEKHNGLTESLYSTGEFPNFTIEASNYSWFISFRF